MAAISVNLNQIAQDIGSNIRGTTARNVDRFAASQQTSLQNRRQASMDKARAVSQGLLDTRNQQVIAEGELEATQAAEDKERFDLTVDAGERVLPVLSAAMNLLTVNGTDRAGDKWDGWTRLKQLADQEIASSITHPDIKAVWQEMNDAVANPDPVAKRKWFQDIMKVKNEILANPKMKGKFAGLFAAQEAGVEKTKGRKAFMGKEPFMTINKETGEKQLNIAIVDPNDGSVTTEVVPIGEGFELTKQTPGEKQADRVTTIKERARSALEKEIAKGNGVRVSEAIARVGTATDSLIELRRLETLLARIDTGGWSKQIAAEMARITGDNSFKTVDQQVAISMMQQRAIRSLEAFPGQISEGERKFVVDMGANFGKVSAANRIIIGNAIEEQLQRIAKGKAITDVRTQGAQAMLAALDQFEGQAAEQVVNPPQPEISQNQPIEGSTATGPNGQKIILRNGQWQTL